MSNPSSLEHCYTNLFALTNIDGIKWKCLVTRQTTTTLTQKASLTWEPVIKFYGECLQENLLCAWRRVPFASFAKKAPIFEKELWVFWFEEDPVPLSAVNNRELTVRTQGCWKDAGSLSYDCRILIFKAYHNMIERCLLKQGFARFERWFIMPEETSPAVSIPKLAFAFDFFLHGENRICVMIDVEERSRVRRIDHRDVIKADQEELTVMLSPFGLKARLSGTHELSKPSVERRAEIFEEWNRYYPIALNSTASFNEELDDVVEICVDSTRMSYPAAYVFVVESHLFVAKRNQRIMKAQKKHKSKELFEMLLTRCLVESAEFEECVEESGLDVYTDHLVNEACTCACPPGSRPDQSRCGSQEALMMPSMILSGLDRSIDVTDESPLSSVLTSPFSSMPPSTGMIATPTGEYISQRSVQPLSVASSCFSPYAMHTASTGPSSVPQQASPYQSKSGVCSASRPSACGTDAVTDSDAQSSVKKRPLSPIDSSSSPQLIPPVTLKSSRTSLTDPRKFEQWSTCPSVSTVELSLISIPLSINLYNFKNLAHINHWTRSCLNSVNPTGDILGSYFMYSGHNAETMSSLDVLWRNHNEVDAGKVTLYCDPSQQQQQQQQQQPLCRHRNAIKPHHKEQRDISPASQYVLGATVRERGANGVLGAIHVDETQKKQSEDLIVNPRSSWIMSADRSKNHACSAVLSDDNGHADHVGCHRITHTEGLCGDHVLDVQFTPPQSVNINAICDEAMSVNDDHVLLERHDGTHDSQCKSLVIPNFEQLLTPPSLESQGAATSPWTPSDHCMYAVVDTPCQEIQSFESVHSQPLSDFQDKFSPLLGLSEHFPLIQRKLSIDAGKKVSYAPTLRQNHKANPIRYPELSSAILADSTATTIDQIKEFYKCRADALCLNMSLSDSPLNLYRDINFDSCPLCACVKSSNEALRGSDVLPYLSGRSPDFPVTTCSCGFRATVNHRLASHSGLLAEDEFDLILRCSSKLPKTMLSLDMVKPAQAHHATPFIGVLHEGLINCFNPGYRMRELQRVFQKPDDRLAPIDSYLQDHFVDALHLGFRQARETVIAQHAMRSSYYSLWKNSELHPWISDMISVDSDLIIFKFLQKLKPFLQEAIQRRGIVTKIWDTVIGPLTWKHFIQLLQSDHVASTWTATSRTGQANTGCDDQADISYEQGSEPLPVPYIIVGQEGQSANADSEGLQCSPFILKVWANQCLEPTGQKRDVGFICLAPVTAVNQSFHRCPTAKYVANFLSDMTFHYETMRLGVHRPASRYTTSSSAGSGEWPPGIIPFAGGSLSSHRSGDLFVEAYKRDLVETLDRNLNELKQTGFQFSEAIFHPDPPSSKQFASSGDLPYSILPPPPDLDESLRSCHPPSLVVYVIANKDNQALRSRTVDGQAACPRMILETLTAVERLREQCPIAVRSRIHLHFIPMEWVFKQDKCRNNMLKHLALTVYSRHASIVERGQDAQHVTNFGELPRVTDGNFQSYMCDIQNVSLSMSPPYMLARETNDNAFIVGQLESQNMAQNSLSHTDINFIPASLQLKATVLFCSYCPSEDQRYILATCCDDTGQMLESKVINIDTTESRLAGSSLTAIQRSKLQKQYRLARRAGQARLWDFVLSLVSKLCQPCRLVMNRFGRLGHNELRGWACLMSKRNLQQVTSQFKQECHTCSLQQQYNRIPLILSACLTSFEPHKNIRVLPNAVCERDTHAAGLVQTSTGNTNKVSCSHVLAFPMSASVQVQSASSMQGEQGLQDFDELLFGGLDLDAPELASTFMSPPLSPVDGDITKTETSAPRNDAESNETRDVKDPYGTLRFLLNNEENVLLDQQPLAVGLYISTAPANQLPSWARRKRRRFWDCESQCNTFKVNLHLNIPCAQESDDMLLQTRRVDGHRVDGKDGCNTIRPTSMSKHPLDSTTTFIALRYVLEQFHRLSWLIFNEDFTDRNSCLPMNIQVLSQLYRLFDSMSVYDS